MTMTRLEFDPIAEQHKDAAINAAKADEPDFMAARQGLAAARAEVERGCDNPLAVIIYAGRIANDLGVVDVRQGLYERSYQGVSSDEALRQVRNGASQIQGSYILLRTTQRARWEEVAEHGWSRSLNAHLTGTMNTWFRATQTAQLLAGEIGIDKPADAKVVAAQWMLGRGRADEPGAWSYGRNGDNGYFSTQTAFLGVRGERVNGGREHNLKALKWFAMRGVPELLRRTVTDPTNGDAAWKTAGRLTLESLSRRRAIEAALDYRRF